MKLEMQNIFKSFGSNEVLKGVSIEVNEGDILGLLGENGAGKSTLMNILGAVLPSDKGEILIDGQVMHFHKPSDSINAGIAFIHQELNLINDLAIYENMFLGRELKNEHAILDKQAMIQQTKEVFDQMSLELDPKALVSSLDASYKQFIEIAKALMMKASVIIMDEPTSSLTDKEINQVFKMMQNLANHGVSMIFISHKLNEVMEICTKFTVLRGGELIITDDICNTDPSSLARHMVGHDVRTIQLERNKNITDNVLEIKSLKDNKYFSDINICLKKGEILGVTGLLGDGRSELFRTIFGDLQAVDGEIYINNQIVKIKSTQDALKHGIAYLPRNRKENGIVKDMSILENGSLVTMKKISEKGFINFVTMKQQFDKQKKELRIKMGRNSELITSLSGGNQQKVVLAKWLSADPQVLILDNPTQGVDVGAKEEIYDIIMNLAEKGVAIVILSSEAKEIIRLCDRTLVMYHGKIVAEVSGERMNEHEIMFHATGSSMNGEEYYE